MISPPPIDLLSVESFAGGQPHDQFRWLREHAPVYRHPEPDGPGFWAITRHADVDAVGRDADTYSSWRGGIHIPDATAEELAGARNMMLYMDPPMHTRFRLLVNKGFTPRNVASLAERIGVLSAQIVDDVIERGECDFVSDIAGALPSFVIAELMGIPLEDGRLLYAWTETMHAAEGAVPDAERQQAGQSMMEYAAQTARAKRAQPGSDIASILIQSEIDGDSLSEDEFNAFFLLLINAGGDTTRALVAGGMLALLQHPNELDRLRQDLDQLLPTAVEELLRYVSPVVYMRRTATRATSLGGKRLREGDKVVMYYGAANRDPAVFPDPDRLDVGRSPNDHQAFGGGGPHFCLGAHLARLEARTLLREVLLRLVELRVAGDVEWLPSVFIAAPRTMPVKFRPGPRRG